MPKNNANNSKIPKKSHTKKTHHQTHPDSKSAKNELSPSLSIQPRNDDDTKVKTLYKAMKIPQN